MDLQSDGTSIHDFTGHAHLQADCANEYLGGGVLSGGGVKMNVQKGTEDILVPKAPKDFYCMVEVVDETLAFLEEGTSCKCSVNDDPNCDDQLPHDGNQEDEQVITLDQLRQVETRVSAQIEEVSAYYESRLDAAAKYLQELENKLDSYQRRFG